MKHVIDRARIFSFKFKIVKCPSDCILIGLVDKKRKGDKTSYETEHAIAYFSSGFIYPEKKKMGKGFTQGNVVETIVDLNCGTVQWKVNDILQATAYQHNLSEEEKEFVPYFEMFYVGETIEWISGSYL